MSLPTFLIIGTMKGGTTSLYHYLSVHPEVFMSETKELHYFVAEKNLPRGIGWYHQQFNAAGDAKAVGEASPDYTKYPLYQGVPERIARLIPSVRLIYVIRNPLERIRSHYLHDLARGRERRPIGEAVPGNEHYLAPSRYALQIERYLEHFPRDQLLVVTSESLRHERHAAMRRIHDFIDVTPDLQRLFRTSSSIRRTGRRLLGFSSGRRATCRAPRAFACSRPGRSWPLSVCWARRGGRSTSSRARCRRSSTRQVLDELETDLARLCAHMDEGFDAWGLL